MTGPENSHHSQPIGYKTKTDHDLVARVFPRFRQFDCFCSEFPLAFQGISLSSDLPLCLLRLQFYNTQSKRALSTPRENFLCCDLQYIAFILVLCFNPVPPRCDQKKKTYPYIVATFPSRTECKRGNTENWLPIRRGGGKTGSFYCDRTQILLTPPPPPNKNWLVPVNSPSQKKVLGSLWQLEELMEESSAQTDQPNHLSWKLYFSWHLWARFLLLNLKWHKNIIYCFHT